MAGNTLKRREFIGRSATLGAAALIGTQATKGWARTGRPDAQPIGLAVVSGTDAAAMTAKAVSILGGMGAFVPKGAKVALLPNVQSKHPGTFTKPEILRSVIKLCKAAGASEIACLSLLTQAHWDGAGLAQVVQEEGITLKLIPRDEANFKAVAIPGGQALTEARVPKELDGYDLYINMPITKDHAGNKFTGTLKNHMGLNSGASNRTFHKTNWKTDPADIEHLETCIVDLNTVFKPHLNIVDATEIITSNGPMGPGDLAKPGKIIAGVDRVAIDAYCAKEIIGLNPADVVCIRKAFERKLGEIDLRKVRIETAKV
ncbi:MAG: DUF362 domain-containing protein [Candidatus Aminicenantes bacterium]|nr:DUF362 domain-containing protein [Candidatus Aminicenantes bacterium]